MDFNCILYLHGEMPFLDNRPDLLYFPETSTGFPDEIEGVRQFSLTHLTLRPVNHLELEQHGFYKNHENCRGLQTTWIPRMCV